MGARVGATASNAQDSVTVMVANDSRIDIEQAPAPRGHPWFAAVYDVLTRWGESRLLRRLRHHIVGGATGRILEIGAGTGANFAYYLAAAELVAIDPDPYMLRRAQMRVEALGFAVNLCQCLAEALPFANASFNTVVATLVFCSVADIDAAVSELRRVLRANSTLRYIEHVRADGSVG
jgi:ubiquinone/menaquinone biosynthesis C-methylase UbiE